MPKRTDSEILKDLRDIEVMLSPENLHCDGEISPAQARKRGNKLLKDRSRLIEELGRHVTEIELWGTNFV